MAPNHINFPNKCYPIDSSSNEKKRRRGFTSEVTFLNVILFRVASVGIASKTREKSDFRLRKMTIPIKSLGRE